MNVTFLENVPNYPKTHIQGEHLPIEEEYQFWDIPILDISEKLLESNNPIEPSEPSPIREGN